MAALDVVVIGGGIAGLSALHALAPARRALLIEAETALAAHASGKNAAIYRPLELDRTSAPLALRTRELWKALEPRAGTGFLLANGLVLASAQPAQLEALHAHARASGVECERCEGEALYARAPWLKGGELSAALFVPSGGVIDLQALNSALARSACAAGAEIRLGTKVEGLVVAREAIAGVVLADGTRIAAARVVLAAGAANNRIAASAGVSLPLTPFRRHLVQLAPRAEIFAEQHPVVWRIDDEMYFRPEPGGVLASPCDEQAADDADPIRDPAQLERLAVKLARSAPALAGSSLRHYWACLRTFAADRELVVGEDPRIAGLYWFAGLGGRGMGVAPAAGELLAALIRGESPALAASVAPARFL